MIDFRPEKSSGLRLLHQPD